MKILKWLDENFERTINIFLLSAMTIILFIQVIMRRVFNNSLFWSEELARFIFVWIVYIGISHGAKLRRHIKIEAFLMMFPKKARPFIEILGDLLFFAFAIFVIFTSWRWIDLQLMLGQRSPALKIPIWLLFAAPFTGFILTAFRQIQTIIFRIKSIKQGDADG